MAKGPLRVRSVVYTLSPFEQKVMSGLFKDIPHKIEQRISENWLNALFLVVPVVGTYMYAKNYKEKEKLAHRY